MIASVNFFQSAGNSPAIRRLNSLASAGNAAAYAANFSFQAASFAAPLSFWFQPS